MLINKIYSSTHMSLCLLRFTDRQMTMCLCDWGVNRFLPGDTTVYWLKVWHGTRVIWTGCNRPFGRCLQYTPQGITIVSLAISLCYSLSRYYLSVVLCNRLANYIRINVILMHIFEAIWLREYRETGDTQSLPCSVLKWSFSLW